MLLTGRPEGPRDDEFKVLIIGAGIVGLTIAQGLRENGIPFAIFERDEKGARAQGWALTLHWCLRSLERTIGPKLTALLPTVGQALCLHAFC
jgi:2-polyprenyl-6-methoxyphenol hydroxylase-like FAD-dependent oxidoreductase